MAKALSHPTRIAVLQALVKGRTSPSNVASAASASIEVVAYHVRELQSAGLIAVAATQPVRGAVEHFYELTEDGRAVLGALEAVLRLEPTQRTRDNTARSGRAKDNASGSRRAKDNASRSGRAGRASPRRRRRP
ncbi:MAG TPA: helix-turn-helix domain-containing protein [Solirubrobacteraceae bacterium]|nr:helix-turn-helix domain-containing protein [Solirubrobacteraceae bacterium]